MAAAVCTTPARGCPIGMTWATMSEAAVSCAPGAVPSRSLGRRRRGQQLLTTCHRQLVTAAVEHLRRTPRPGRRQPPRRPWRPLPAPRWWGGGRHQVGQCDHDGAKRPGPGAIFGHRMDQQATPTTPRSRRAQRCPRERVPNPAYDADDQPRRRLHQRDRDLASSRGGHPVVGTRVRD
jgi:hypothetical protein